MEIRIIKVLLYFYYRIAGNCQSNFQKLSSIFENFFFEINSVIMHVHFQSVSKRPATNDTSEIF